MMMGRVAARKDASEIISAKYPDLSDEFDPRETNVRSRGQRKQEKEEEALKLNERSKLMSERNLELLYPSMYSSSAAEEYFPSYPDEDSFIVSLTPLRADRLSSMLHVRALTPPRKSNGKRSARAAESSKKPRPRHTYNTFSLKHKLMHFCGASRAIFSGKYMTIPG